MDKYEFLKECEKYTHGKPYINEENYKIVNYVYEWYPTLNKPFAKDQIAMLYCTFGMGIIRDMLVRASTMENLHNSLGGAQTQVDAIKKEIEKLGKVEL